MYYLLERADKICGEISKYIYRETVAIENYQYAEGKYHNLEAIQALDPSIFKPFKTGDLWGGKDCHGWFKASVTVPEAFQGKTIALHFQTFEEGWDATNPQFMLYINGEMVQGLDINHRECILSHEAEGGKTYEIDLHAYAGMLADKKATLHGKLVVVDELARKVYWDIKVPVEACKELDKEDKNRIDMIMVLNDVVNLIDLRKPKSALYDESLAKAEAFLQENFYGKLCGHSDVTATCVGHTHIDVAWLWTVAQTREKVARSFSTVLKLMEEYPEYIFMSSQPQLYDFLKKDYPEIYEKVKAKVKEGVWEPEGAMWLEADCNVTSGESLVRQIMHGKRFFKEEFGVDNKILWLPDVFGYSAALPQILKKSDVDYFMTTKIAWNQFNKIPYDTFMWQGLDGSEVLTHFITTTGPGQDKASHFTTYNGHIQPDTIMGSWRRYQNKNINDDVLVSFGWGDGGGGATLEMLENGRRLAQGLPGVPRVQMGNSLDFFKRLDERVSGHPKLPRWVGELYLEYHRGTYTSMARNKRDNRVCENLYTAAEKINTVAMALGETYPAETIRDSWETILLNQFHDIIPGSSIKEVYDVTEVEYKALIDKAHSLIDQGLKAVTEKIDLADRSVIVWNTLGFERSDVVSFDLPENTEVNAVQLADGSLLPIQKLANGKGIFFAAQVPANGYKAFKLVAETVKAEAIDLAVTGGENPFYKVVLDGQGEISSLVHKASGREIVTQGQKANRLKVFENKPMCFDNWDMDIYYKEKMWPMSDISRIEVVEAGPVRSTIEIERVFLDSKLVQKMHMYKDIERIDFETYADWKENDVILKAEFPVDIHAEEATYEVQYGNVKRPTHTNTSWDVARFEVCGHKWADVSEDAFGVSLLNDSKYGHDIHDGVMGLTLIKANGDPNPDADKEEHYFTYSIYGHAGDWKKAQTAEKAYSLNTKLFAVLEEPHQGTQAPEMSFVSVDQPNVMIEVVKKAEDSDETIVRVYEFHNGRTQATLHFNQAIESVKECNLLERDLEDLSANGAAVSFEIKPYEIKTFKIKFK